MYTLFLCFIYRRKKISAPKRIWKDKCMCAVDTENEVHTSVGALVLARVSIGGRTDLVFVNETLTWRRNFPIPHILPFLGWQCKTSQMTNKGIQSIWRKSTTWNGQHYHRIHPQSSIYGMSLDVRVRPKINQNCTLLGDNWRFLHARPRRGLSRIVSNPQRTL